MVTTIEAIDTLEIVLQSFPDRRSDRRPSADRAIVSYCPVCGRLMALSRTGMHLSGCCHAWTSTARHPGYPGDILLAEILVVAQQIHMNSSS